ncbi:hypothetical protein UNSW1_773 [Campylobacter concisus UNSW1]|nr:hypothetical protein UNSW1_773 [Campylobacter concisus UNSW1]
MQRSLSFSRLLFIVKVKFYLKMAIIISNTQRKVAFEEQGRTRS